MANFTTRKEFLSRQWSPPPEISFNEHNAHRPTTAKINYRCKDIPFEYPVSANKITPAKQRVLVLGETLPIFLKPHLTNYDIEWHIVPILRLDQIVKKVKFALSTMNQNTTIHVLVTDFSWHQIGACHIERRFDSASRVLKHFCKIYHNHETSPSCRIFVLNLYETPFHTNNSCPITNKRILETRAGCLFKFKRGKNVSTGVINIRLVKLPFSEMSPPKSSYPFWLEEFINGCPLDTRIFPLFCFSLPPFCSYFEKSVFLSPSPCHSLFCPHFKTHPGLLVFSLSYVLVKSHK